MPFNGPGRELNGSHDDDEVYCVQCGNVFVWADGRDCPTCTLNERLDVLEEQIPGIADGISDVKATLEPLVNLQLEDADLSPEDRDLINAIRASDAHPDMALYALEAAKEGGTGVLNSLRTFHDGSGVSRIAEVGNGKEVTLWNEGAAAALDQYGNWDVVNKPILQRIAGRNEN